MSLKYFYSANSYIYKYYNLSLQQTKLQNSKKKEIKEYLQVV